MSNHSLLNQRPPSSTEGRGALFAGGAAALLASACCLGPLLLLMLGVSGAWIANLTVLEPARPYFIALALMLLLLAGRRIWRPALACNPDEVCAVPRVNRAYRLLFVVVVALVLVAAAFPYLAPLFY